MTKMPSVLILVCWAAIAAALKLPQQRIGFTLDNQFRKEVSDGEGGVTGSFGARTGDGCLRVTTYKATPTGGFKVLSTRKEDCNPVRTQNVRRPAKEPQRLRKEDDFAAEQPNPPVSSLPPARNKAFADPAPVIVEDEPGAVAKSSEPETTTPREPTTERRNVVTHDNAPPRINDVVPIAGKNVPKKTKKEFDFKALSGDSRARVLDQKEDPVYSFGFTAPGHGHTQSGLADGSKKGEYYFDSLDGWRRIVTYEANENGFFPKMRRVRIPGWTPPVPPPRRTLKGRKKGSGSDDPEGDLNGALPNDDGKSGGGGTDDAGGSGPLDPNAKIGDKDHTKGGPGSDDKDRVKPGEDSGKQLLDSLRQGAGVGSCPYYFFYSTKVNFHWERCMENGTKVGEYGRLHEDGFSYRTSYYADTTGYHPRSTKTRLTDTQRSLVHDFVQGAFIVPKVDEERKTTEDRILQWLEANRELLADPLRA
ncbi:uncharacterized protein LOC108666126 [Hyalella azteca]|uniref:Uncharacterized protein LOC108666126 n=1 Tax=Hyalella azteca TaxID=294128 RepID=A0A8B7N3K1_HYAAZ|nr:uncharacterized protein LOC108666126 [Hyalella azteca]